MIPNYSSEIALIAILLESLRLSNETLAVVAGSVVDGEALVQLNKLIRSNSDLIVLGEKQLKEVCK